MNQALRVHVGGGVRLDADLALPPGPAGRPHGLVLFAHGSGSSRHSPRNRHVAERLRAAGLATLLADLLTLEEEREDAVTRELRFDIGLLARRLEALSDWAQTDARTEGLPTGLFGASTGAAAALVTAASLPDRVHAVVSRGGRPDLAGERLGRVRQPTLLIVGGADPLVLDLNRQAMERLAGEKRLEIVPGATHLFEEPGALDEVARLATAWFSAYL
ncbi:dienelactone hydrolase family protein [Nonomuraea rhodomycinica]|uniref:Dienelactone hydrolase family protein n=1 Tax=Nonomuraea rhodomycinica TaxID=1712872 RepID=A0A7Y6IRV2_9ACTN|nr:dienelactone hydrolase family protein [Nonomuraea rhodomycinica]NUW43267.1 dienelactone hydrolase family protein [Nonomuraea rhodomycinica]